jgi:hypothetical protein
VPQNPCHASCGWCTWFLFSFLILLVAGVLGILGYGEGSVCGMTSNMDEFVNNTYFRLKSGNSTSDQNIDTVVNQCLLSTGSGDFMDGLVVDPATGETAGDVLNSTRAMIDSYNQVFANTTTQKQFVNDPNFEQLIWSMKNYGNMYMMRANEITTLLGSTSTPTVAIRDGFGGVASCLSKTNLTLNGTVGQWIVDSRNAAKDSSTVLGNSITLPGASDYYTSLTSASINIGASSSVCPTGFASVVAGGSSAPFSTLMTYKMGVVNKADYKCDTMAISINGGSGNVEKTITPGLCTYSALGTYINNLADYLTTAAIQMDTVVAQAATALDQAVKVPLGETVIPALDALSNGLDCQFMNSRLNGLNEALCWSHAPGVIGLDYSLIGLGVLGWIAIVMLFCIWRHLRDNRDAWLDATTGAAQIVNDGSPRARATGPGGHVEMVGSAGHSRHAESNRSGPNGPSFGPSVGSSQPGSSMMKRRGSRNDAARSERRSPSPKGNSPSAVQARPGPKGSVVVVDSE